MQEWEEYLSSNGLVKVHQGCQIIQTLVRFRFWPVPMNNNGVCHKRCHMRKQLCLTLTLQLLLHHKRTAHQLSVPDCQCICCSAQKANCNGRLPKLYAMYLQTQSYTREPAAMLLCNIQDVSELYLPDVLEHRARATLHARSHSTCHGNQL